MGTAGVFVGVKLRVRAEDLNVETVDGKATSSALQILLGDTIGSVAIGGLAIGRRSVRLLLLARDSLGLLGEVG